MPLETLLNLMKAFLPRKLKNHIKVLAGVPNIEQALFIMKRNGFNPRIVIDVGACSGDWTRLCKRVFPFAKVLMIEPQIIKKKDMEELLGKYNDVRLENILVGPVKQKSVRFHLVGTASSVLPENVKKHDEKVSLPMTTLDLLTADSDFSSPDFIKLDVQGYEIEVLKGGEAVFSKAEAVLMEVNLIEVNKYAPSFHETISYMADCGFRVYDICSFFRRPHDNALWQVDVIFVRSTSHLVSSKRWS